MPRSAQWALYLVFLAATLAGYAHTPAPVNNAAACYAALATERRISANRDGNDPRFIRRRSE
jgi:hypothetical protein